MSDIYFKKSLSLRWLNEVPDIGILFSFADIGSPTRVHLHGNSSRSQRQAQSICLFGANSVGIKSGMLVVEAPHFLTSHTHKRQLSAGNATTSSTLATLAAADLPVVLRLQLKVS